MQQDVNPPKMPPSGAFSLFLVVRPISIQFMKTFCLAVGLLILFWQNSHAQSSPDTDKDRITDADEAKLGTDPSKSDSDGDGTTDYDEISYGINPLDPLDKVIKVENDKNSPVTLGLDVVTFIKNGKEYKEKSSFQEKILHFDINKSRLISQRSFKNIIAAAKIEAASKKAGDEELNRMEKECNRLYQEMQNNPSQVNDAKYWQAYSEMMHFKWQLYPGSMWGVGGRSSKIDDLEQKIDRLQDTVEELER